MKPIALLPGCRYRFATILCAVSISTLVHAGPGAHGPNGEHLDGAAAGSAQGGASPRVEAKSETFELVGRLEDGVFAIFIDRFATNEPVLSANVEVEAGNTRAKAAFRAAQGLIRHKLSDRVTMRRSPELRFAYDSAIARGNRVEEILAEIGAEVGSQVVQDPEPVEAAPSEAPAAESSEPRDPG